MWILHCLVSYETDVIYSKLKILSFFSVLNNKSSNNFLKYYKIELLFV